MLTPGQLLWRHRRGMTLDELAGLTGRSRYAIYRLLKAERWRTGEVVITEKCLRAMVEDGLTVRQMAERQMCSTACICKKVSKYHIQLRPPGNPKWAHETRGQNEKSRG